MQRQADQFKIIGLLDNEMIVGYGIIEPTTGDIPQFTVAKPYRRNGYGTLLLRSLTELNAAEQLKFINIESSISNMNHFLLHYGVQPGCGQHEMILKL